MLDDKTMCSAVARLVAAATSPSQVILFGSYARGTADEGSGLDLLVIEREILNKADDYMRLRDKLGRAGPGCRRGPATVSGVRVRSAERGTGPRPIPKRGMKARCCMTPFVDEAKRLLRIATRDYQTFTILNNYLWS